MTKAICFNCDEELPIGKSMEELLDVGLPVFCSLSCADFFPSNGTPAYKERIKVLTEKFSINI